MIRLSAWSYYALSYLSWTLNRKLKQIPATTATESLWNEQETVNRIWLARNGDGSVAIAVRAQSEVVLPPETLLRAQQQTAQMKLLEKAKELQRYCIVLNLYRV